MERRSPLCWEGRGVGAWGEGSLEPAEALARAPGKRARGQSRQPGRTRPPPDSPGLGTLAGSEAPRAPRPAFARGTLPWVAGARSEAQSRAAGVPGRRPTRPHSLALAAALALAPDRWRSWPVQTQSSQLPGRPAPSRRRRRGVRRAARHAPASCSPAAAAPPAPSHQAQRHSDPGDPPGGRGGRGGGAGRDAAARVSPWPREWKARAAAAPSGRGGGQCSSLLPSAGVRLVAGGGGRLRARGGGALLWGHDRARKRGARDRGNCCGIALAFLCGEVDHRGARRGAPPRGQSGVGGCSLGGKTRPGVRPKDGCPPPLGAACWVTSE